MLTHVGRGVCCSPACTSPRRGPTGCPSPSGRCRGPSRSPPRGRRRRGRRRTGRAAASCRCSRDRSRCRGGSRCRDRTAGRPRAVPLLLPLPPPLLPPLPPPLPAAAPAPAPSAAPASAPPLLDPPAESCPASGPPSAALRPAAPDERREHHRPRDGLHRGSIRRRGRRSRQELLEHVVLPVVVQALDQDEGVAQVQPVRGARSGATSPARCDRSSARRAKCSACSYSCWPSLRPRCRRARRGA